MTEPIATHPVQIPPYVERYPECPLCLDECSHDGDSICCETCGIYWPGSKQPGMRYEESDEHACGAEHQPWADNHPHVAEQRFRCVLDLDHEGDHRGVRCDRPGSDHVHAWARTATETEGPTVVTATTVGDLL